MNIDVEKDLGDLADMLRGAGIDDGATYALNILSAFREQQRQLYEMLDMMVGRWPDECMFDDVDELAGILGVELWGRREPHAELRWRPVPDGMDADHGIDVEHTEGWERE